MPPTFTIAMGELASTPDAKARNRCRRFLFDEIPISTIGKHRARSTPETGRQGRRPWHLQRAQAV
jgi:hypothetical protein